MDRIVNGNVRFDVYDGCSVDEIKATNVESHLVLTVNLNAIKFAQRYSNGIYTMRRSSRIYSNLLTA